MNDNNAASPRSLASSLADDPGQTVYGPAVLGTMRVIDPEDIAALRGLRAPAIPRPAPALHPPMPQRPAVTGVIAHRPARAPGLAALGAALAIVAAPVGLMLSAIALYRILRARPRPPGELLAVLAIAASVLTIVAALAVAAR